MNRSRWVLIAAVFLCLLCIGAPCKKKKKTPSLTPNWNRWSDPGVPLALDETDPSGDHAAGGSAADLELMQGTYDNSFVYIHIDVYSSPAIDETGNTMYGLVIDANDSGTDDTGDFAMAWDGVYGFEAWDYDLNPLGGIWFRIDPTGGLDFAFPRSWVDQTVFGVSAGTMYNSVDADDVPPYPAWAAFTFR